MSESSPPDVTAQEQVPASISAAAHAYQVAMQQPSATPPAATTPAPMAQAPETTKDVVMTDGTTDRPAVSLCPPPLGRLSAEHQSVPRNPSRRNKCPEPSSSENWYALAQCERQRCRFSSYVSAPRSRAYDPKGSSTSWCTDETISE